MSDRGEAVLETIRSYVRAFETLRPDAVVPFFNEPSLFVSSEGVVPLLNNAHVVAFFTRIMDRLRDDGYASSAFPDLTVLDLSDVLMSVRAVGSWKRADGSELRRLGVTYTLRNGDAGWRIVVAVAHDP